MAWESEKTAVALRKLQKKYDTMLPLCTLLVVMHDHYEITCELRLVCDMA